MRKPRTYRRLAKLLISVLLLFAAEIACSIYLPKFEMYMFLSGIIWMMLFVAWFIDIMGDAFKYLYWEMSEKGGRHYDGLR